MVGSNIYIFPDNGRLSIFSLIMKVSAIVCIGYNGSIGNKGQLLYHIPEDMKRFRKTTVGHTVIMGRKTFESLPDGPLSNRRNIVISKTLKNSAGIEVFSSLEAALDACKDESEVFIIGGAQIYKECVDIVNRLYITMVDDRQSPKDVDTFLDERILEKFGGRQRVIEEGEKTTTCAGDVYFACLTPL